ncbi:MAG: transcriptional repressor NrdR [Candidatus Magasanikbacteria bacterium]|nr:transcriptional repressor NrdR [Candidatus Magasanikbacteria bacterium]
MRCPVCNYKDTKVVDSRLSLDGSTIRRRRECFKCRYRFSTREEAEILDLMVVKRDGRAEPYSRDKIVRGLQKALEKCSYTKEAFENLTRSIERDIQKKRKREIKSQEIGEILMNRLKSFDKVAYIRFASVYRAFEDVDTFKKELEALVRNSSPSSVRKKRAVTKRRRRV